MSHVQKYQNRSGTCAHLNMIEYFTYYPIVSTDEDEEVHSGEYNVSDDEVNYNSTTYAHPSIEEKNRNVRKNGRN